VRLEKKCCLNVLFWCFIHSTISKMEEMFKDYFYQTFLFLNWCERSRQMFVVSNVKATTVMFSKHCTVFMISFQYACLNATIPDQVQGHEWLYRPFTQQTCWRVILGKVQVLLITLTTSRCIKVSEWTITIKWNSAIIHFTIYTCAFPTVAC